MSGRFESLSGSEVRYLLRAADRLILGRISRWLAFLDFPVRNGPWAGRRCGGDMLAIRINTDKHRWYGTVIHRRARPELESRAMGRSTSQDFFYLCVSVFICG